jgi:hypothetical protein
MDRELVTATMKKRRNIMLNYYQVIWYSFLTFPCSFMITTWVLPLISSSDKLMAYFKQVEIDEEYQRLTEDRHKIWDFVPNQDV